MKQYPILVDLRDRLVVVVGGGRIAQQKIASLLAALARIRVVSLSLIEPLTELVAAGRISYHAKRFEPSDLDDAWLVIAATNDQATNEQVYRAAEARRLFCNTVDYRPLCSFISPAVVERGGITVAISTDGGSPTLAQRLKQIVATAIGDEYVELVEILRALRPRIRRTVPDLTQRNLIFHTLVDSEMLALLRRGQRAEAETLAEKIVAELSAPAP